MSTERSAAPASSFPWRATAVRALGSVNLGLGLLDLGLAAVYGVLRAGQVPSSAFNPQALFFSLLVELGRIWQALELAPYLGDLAGQGTLLLFNHPPFYDAYMEVMLALHMGLGLLHLALGAGLRRLDRRALRVQVVLATAGIVFSWLTFPMFGAAVASILLAGVAALTWHPIRESTGSPFDGGRPVASGHPGGLDAGRRADPGHGGPRRDRHDPDRDLHRALVP